MDNIHILEPTNEDDHRIMIINLELHCISSTLILFYAINKTESVNQSTKAFDYQGITL